MTIPEEQLEQIGEAIDLGLLDVSEIRGRVVVCTGKMGYTRQEMHQFISALGGFAAEAITWNTQVLIVGDTGVWGKTNKITEAQQRGVRILTEAEFVASIRGSVSS